MTKSFIEDGENPDPEGANIIDNVSEASNLADKASALFNIVFAVGSLVGPPLGGGFYDAFDWHYSCLIMSAVSILAGIVYTFLLCHLRGKNQ